MKKRALLAGGDHRSSDWTALPGELIASIRGRLPLADFARFPAVCTAWRRPTPSSTPAPQIPWVMVPSSSPCSCSSPGAGDTCYFFSPTEGKTYHVPLPELRGTYCVGSCDGWVASFNGATAEISLVNPFTRARIRFPPLTSISDVMAERDEEGRIVEYTIHSDHVGGSPEPYTTGDVHGLVKVVCMSSKPTDSACKLGAILDLFFPPASIVVGGEKWKGLEGEEELLDIVYHSGDGKFYGLSYDDRFLRWDAGNGDTVEYCRPGPDFPEDSHERHLAVHRPSGDLLLVFIDVSAMRKFRVIGGAAYKTQTVKVFRYKDDGGSAGAWLRLYSLSGCSLFLVWNGSQSICLSAEDVPELRAECIFFINRSLGYGDREACWAYRLWVYILKEGILEPYCREWRSSCEAALWFTPNLS